LREKLSVFAGPGAVVPGAVAYIGFDPPALCDRSRITMVVKSIQSCVNLEEIKAHRVLEWVIARLETA
jgi:hypothetical protein